MQRLMVYLSVIGLFLAACSAPAGPVIVPTEVAPTPAEPTPMDPTQETPTEEPAANPADVPAADAAVRALAALLGLDPSAIKVISAEAVEWSDSCLGIAYIDAICAQMIVPGYRLVLEANGHTFTYHTNEDGSQLAIAPLTVESAAEAAAQAVRAALARALGLPEYRVSVVSYEAVEWNDSCLGVVRINASCLAAITPGYLFILEANGQLFEYHTDADGGALIAAPVSEAAAAQPAAQAAIAALMKALGLPADQIRVVSVAAREWSDACLGVSVPGMACAEVITPGYSVVLEANEGQLYEYHTNEDGTSVQAASVALSWNRNGGIAGFCDELIVYRSGEIVAYNCGSENVAQGALATLDDAQVAQFSELLAKYGPVTIMQDDGAVADSMQVGLNLAGTGTEQPDEAGQQALLDWATNLYTQLQPAG